MALEVKVFREITEYQPKVVFGLSWRQVATALVMIPVLGGVFALLYWYGQENTGVVVVTVLALPAAAYGWVRPMGIPFEQYFGYYWAHLRGQKHFHYQDVDYRLVIGQMVRESDDGKKKKEARPISRRTRRARRRFASFEAAN